MKRLLNVMRIQAQMAMSDVTYVKTGMVSGYNPDNFTVKVTLQPEDVETGWLPLLSPWVGNGWGMFCAPAYGDQMEVQFEQGSSEAAFACMRFFNDTARPLPAPSGEFWLVHKLGAFVKLTNDGKLLINGQAEIDLTAPTIHITTTGDVNLTAGGNITSSAAAWNHTGPVHIDGPIQGTSTLTVPTVTGTTDVIFAGTSAVAHTHFNGTLPTGKTGLHT